MAFPKKNIYFVKIYIYFFYSEKITPDKKIHVSQIIFNFLVKPLIFKCLKLFMVQSDFSTWESLLVL